MSRVLLRYRTLHIEQPLYAQEASIKKENGGRIDTIQYTGDMTGNFYPEMPFFKTARKVGCWIARNQSGNY